MGVVKGFPLTVRKSLILRERAPHFTVGALKFMAFPVRTRRSRRNETVSGIIAYLIDSGKECGSATMPGSVRVPPQRLDADSKLPKEIMDEKCLI